MSRPKTAPLNFLTARFLAALTMGHSIRKALFKRPSEPLEQKPPADYQTDLFVEQLDADDTILKSYIFKSAYPRVIGQIDLTSDEASALEEFEVTWRYQHFEASGVNF